MRTPHTITRWLVGVFLILVVLPLFGAVYTYTRAGESARVYAATASTVNFQARLMNSNGSLVADGSYSIQFKLYTAVTGGTNEWTEDQTVTVKNGYMSANLGVVTPFGGTIDWSQEKWLTMNVNGDGEMTPRIKLTAVPYAFRAGQADSLSITGGTISGDGLLQIGPGSVQSLSSANAGLRINQTGSGGLVQLQGNGSDVFTIDKSGNINSSGSLVLGGGLTLGNSTSTTAGTIRWTGTDFEGYDGFNWLSLRGGGGSIGTPFVSKTKTANETVNASTVFQDDDQLFFPVGANETWNFRFTVQANAPAAADLKFTVIAPSGAVCTFSSGDFEGATSVANLGCGVSTGLVPGNGAADTYEIIGTVTNGTTSGNVRLQWAEQVASGVTTVFSGSYVQASRSIGGPSTSVAFIQDGNTLGADAVLGTNDPFNLNFETNGVTNLTLDTSGNLNIINGGLQTAGTTRITNSGLLQNVTADTGILTSGTLGVARGGTGLGAVTQNALLIGNSASALAETNVGSGGQLLVANSSGVPTFVSLSGDATLNDTGGLTLVNGAVSNAKLQNSGLNVSYGTNLSGDASVSLGGTLNINFSATPSFTSVSTGTLTTTGAIAAPTTVNTINGLIINSGALSAVTGFDQTSGTFSVTGTGGITLGGGSNALTIDSTNFDVSSAGAVSGITSISASGGITAATSNTINGLNINSGALSGVTGFGQTSGSFSLSGTGNINIGGGSNALVIDSTNFDVTSAGAVSGVTTLGLSGAITGATSNTINGLSINSGALSSVTGFAQSSGTFSVTGTGGITLGGGSNALTIDSTNFDVSSAGALGGITSISASGTITANTTGSINGLNINSGSLSGVTGFSQASGAHSITGNGAITVGGGSNALTIDSTAFDVTSTGALSGITTLSLSGAITGATATNTLNGLVVNSGSLSSITGFNQGSGNFAISGAGTFGTGTGAVSLNGATTISTSTNGANALTVNGTTGTAADALRIAQTGNAGNLVMTNNAATAGSLVSLTHSASAFSGTGLLLNFASGTGSFNGNYIDFQLNGTSRFKVDSNGALTINAGSNGALATIGVNGGLTYFNVNATNNRVQIGSSAGDANSILFVLDSGSSDPTGVNGGSYYNTTDNRNRCFENGQWTDCISRPVLGETTLGANAASITVNLNQSYTDLKCSLHVKGRSASSIMYMRFNGDTAANSYGWNSLGLSGTVTTRWGDNSDSEIQLSGTVAGTIPFVANIQISNFNDIRKTVNYTASGGDPIGTNANTYSGVGVWANTTNYVTSVTFLPSTGNLLAGTTASCDGR